MHTQLVVLGGGPGGYAAAFLAADRGMEVTLVDSEPQLGGTCLLRGCIPSKSLLHIARVIAEVEQLNAGWGIRFEGPTIDLDQLRARKEKLVRTLSGGLGQLAKRRKVRRITARGTFHDSSTLNLDGPELTDRQLTFDHAILATGSVPIVPEPLKIRSPRLWNSSVALDLPEIPETLLVVGGGYIGLELGTVYARLGCQVTVVEMTDGILPGVDRDLVRPLHRRLEKLLANRILLNTEVSRLQDTGDAVEVTLQRVEQQTAERFARVLVCVGRRPASHGLGLENTQVEIDARGFIACDRHQHTTDPKILAIGDIAGAPMLAHKATHQAKVAVECLHGDLATFDKQAIPAVVFTDPEIAWAGLTELEASQRRRPVEIAVYPWAASGRAHAMGQAEGLTKWLIDPESQHVLGCGIVGPGAGELISEAVLALEMECHIRDISETIHPHPTLSETLMNAAEVHFGSAVEIYKPKRPKSGAP